MAHSFGSRKNIPNTCMRKYAKLFQNIPNYKKLSKPKFAVQRLSKYPKLFGRANVSIADCDNNIQFVASVLL